MSELPQCPYCGAILWDGQVKNTEEGTELICDACARSYVYIPGYGSFALSDVNMDEHLEGQDIISFPQDVEFQDSQDGPYVKACLTLCCLLSTVPFLLIMVVLLLGSFF
jgi:hypothetical protein